MSDGQEVRVELVEGMHFVGYGYPFREEASVHLDSAEAFGGTGQGDRPQSLLLVSLCGCTAMDVMSILRKKRQTITGLEVRARAARAEDHPRVYTAIHLTFLVRGSDIDPAAVQRAIDLSLDSYCPVAAMLKPVVPIDSSFEILSA
jgi:putative redox protein